LKTFLLTRVIFASLIGLLISISHLQPARHIAAHTKQAIVKSSSSLHDNQLSLDSGVADVDDNDEPIQPRSVDNITVTCLNPFLPEAPCLPKNCTSDASHCILIHCLKI
jgi:hypothetical protein